MIKILFFQCCRSGKVSECWNSTTCGSKGNSTQCVRDSNRCNVWENKGKLMKIKLRCSNIYFIWLCTCAVVSLTFLGINFHGMSKITISRIHTFMVNVPVSTIFYYIPGIHFNEHIWFRGSINWWSKSTKNGDQGCWWNHSIISLTNMYFVIDMIWYDPWGTMHLHLLYIFFEVCCCKVAHFIKIYMF